MASSHWAEQLSERKYFVVQHNSHYQASAAASHPPSAFRNRTATVIAIHTKNILVENLLPNQIMMGKWVTAPQGIHVYAWEKYPAMDFSNGMYGMEYVIRKIVLQI